MDHVHSHITYLAPILCFVTKVSLVLRSLKMSPELPHRTSIVTYTHILVV